MDYRTLPSPLWVLGTDTGVGKTYVAGRIAREWSTLGPVVYRKPFQTGVDRADHPSADALAVAGPAIAANSCGVLREPLAPLAAAEREGRILDLAAVKTWCTAPVSGEARLLMEGVGGVMVPLAENIHFLAWASDMGIPAVVVARGGLGTLNHTLLTCEALMLRNWRIPAVLLNPGPDGSHAAAVENAALLARFLPCPVHVID
jgi:dethiobiotin synthase